MKKRKFEEQVEFCYSTWGETYYDEYYGEKASYPPVHRDLAKRILKEGGVRILLDAGCGPASFLRDLADDGMDLYGFDLTPEMVMVGKKVLLGLGLPEDHIWQGSVLDPVSYVCPVQSEEMKYDAVICIGVMPHIPSEEDVNVIKNLRGAVKDEGLVIVEARNQLFSLFTQNRYSYEFIFNELFRMDEMKKKNPTSVSLLKEVSNELGGHFRMDLPPVRKGKEDEPGYDEVLSRTHNPLVLKEQFSKAGFKDVRVLFYHYHCLPPMFSSKSPEFFIRESLAMEDPEDWRGYFMASAFLLVGNKSG